VAADQAAWTGIFWTLDGKWLVVSTRDSPNEPMGYGCYRWKQANGMLASHSRQQCCAKAASPRVIS
jgi:hypothetical protein